MKKILIVEDDEKISRMYERMFRFDGFDIELAFNGLEAINKLKLSEILPSVILMDVSMPEMNGYTLLKEIKKEERFKNIPVAVLTNSFIRDFSQEFYELGADLYLVKLNQTSEGMVGKINNLIINSCIINK